jgi:hypothetical protein
LKINEYIKKLKNMKEKCQLFLDTYNVFEWFIIKYFGIEYLNELIELAKSDDIKENKLLMVKLNDIWFKLPDHIFNIKENPKGWIEFLNIIEI